MKNGIVRELVGIDLLGVNDGGLGCFDYVRYQDDVRIGINKTAYEVIDEEIKPLIENFVDEEHIDKAIIISNTLKKNSDNVKIVDEDAQKLSLMTENIEELTKKRNLLIDKILELEE